MKQFQNIYKGELTPFLCKIPKKTRFFIGKSKKKRVTDKESQFLLIFA